MLVLRTVAILLGILLATTAVADPRPREPMDAGELQLALERLQVLGGALYVAAHPDDENTSMLTWLSRGRLVRTAYLALTRGDGGQNLIGAEAGELLGVIRTHELLAARRLDGAEQFFTRARDFGYSKTADETLEFWGREEVLADIVRVIRTFRPDVVITRFPADGAGGHGHHTASALLARAAFEAAADPARFPDQGLPAWRAKRLVWNAWRPDTSKSAPSRVTVDLGAYNALLGRSYTEIAGASRSMHKSQGFGAPERRGSIPNELQHLAGDRATRDLFEGVDLTWGRVRGGSRVARLLREAAAAFDPAAPERSLPALLRAHAAMRELDDPWVGGKLGELGEAIRSCAGLWVEAIAVTPSAAPGGQVEVTATILNRSSFPLVLESLEMPFGTTARAAGAAEDSAASLAGRTLLNNRPVAARATVSIPADFRISQPDWLRHGATKGAFRVADGVAAIAAESAPPLVVRFAVRAGTERLVFETPVAYRWTDRVQGERYRLFEVTPPAVARFDQGVYLFPDAAPREIRVTVQSLQAPAQGTLRLEVPAGWSARPTEMPFDLARESEISFAFTVAPPAGAAAGALAASVAVGGRTWSHRLARIDYPHIPEQTLFPPAEARLVRADVRHAGTNVAYVMGSGDSGPEALRQIGYRVTLLDDQDLEDMDLSAFDAIVVGVRAYNTRPRLRVEQPRLLDFVRSGGTLVVQYQTVEEELQDRLGPFPFKLSRDRVTVEEAPVRFVNGDAPPLRTPNVLGPSDFEGWVQERGLYFAQPWDPRYQALLSSNDPGEPARDGGLLFARVGKGAYVYTGYAFFRQLPAGVPGAYRLFANLVSAGSAR